MIDVVDIVENINFHQIFITLLIDTASERRKSDLEDLPGQWEAATGFGGSGTSGVVEVRNLKAKIT